MKRRKDLGIEALLPVLPLRFVNASPTSSLVQPDHKMHSETHPRICTTMINCALFDVVLRTYHVYFSSISDFLCASGKGQRVFCLLYMT